MPATRFVTRRVLQDRLASLRAMRDRRIEMRSPQLAQALPVWAGGYEHTVPAALALLAALEAHNAVPAKVSRHIRMLATMAPRPFNDAP